MHLDCFNRFSFNCIQLSETHMHMVSYRVDKNNDLKKIRSFDLNQFFLVLLCRGGHLTFVSYKDFFQYHVFVSLKYIN